MSKINALIKIEMLADSGEDSGYFGIRPVSNKIVMVGIFFPEE